MKHEVNFHDKDTQFYRFRDSESSVSHVTNERDSEDDLQEGLSLLSQLGPDALLTMILRKWSVCSAEKLQVVFLSPLTKFLSADNLYNVWYNSCLCVCSPSQRSAEDLEVIYEELLHVKAAAHLSTSVSHCIYVKLHKEVVHSILTSRNYSFHNFFFCMCKCERQHFPSYLKDEL